MLLPLGLPGPGRAGFATRAGHHPRRILGPQHTGHLTPQLAVAKKATRASVVIVSVSADDLRWSALLRLCVATPACDNRPAVAYLQQHLASFAVNYYQTLQQLAALPSRPVVLANPKNAPITP